MKHELIYADYNASAPLLDDVKEFLRDRLNGDDFANPNSLHFIGRKLLNRIEKTRQLCSQLLDCDPSNIVFTSGATEAINHIFRNSTLKNDTTFIFSNQEHDAVLAQGKLIEHQGYQTKFVNTLPSGAIDQLHLTKIINQLDTKHAFVSIMSANNETGIIHPIQKIQKIVGDIPHSFFSDTTQIIGKKSFSFSNSKLDFACGSSHKLGALPGSGFLLCKNPELLMPFIHGADQEFGKRAGTQNYLAIETMAIALSSLQKFIKKTEQQKKLQTEFENDLLKLVPELVVIGNQEERTVGTTLISIPGVFGQALQIELESNGIMVSTSSACSDKDPNPSHVLRAIGLEEKTARGTIRISLGLHATKQNYHTIALTLKNVYQTLSRISSF